jgi:hypothetical protein
MKKLTLMTAALALLLAGPASAGDLGKRGPNAPPGLASSQAPKGPPVRLDDHRRHDWRHHDWRRDDDWRRRGWHYHGVRNDGWRYYRGHDHRHWRYVPPYRYSLDFGYRSGYELAWRDWLSHGRYDRYWRRGTFYGYGAAHSYRAGYEAGWRDAAYYYGRGYRPDYWAYDPHGGWYFSFRIAG